MYLVYNLNGLIGGEESWCKRFTHSGIVGATVRTLTALPGLRQALPVQSLYLKHAYTQRAPDVIG